MALGSSKQRIMRQLLSEALLLSMVGGAVGLAGSVALLRWLSVWQPFPGINVHIPVAPDWRAYVIALGLALLSGCLFGIVPVRQVFRTDPYQIVKAGTSARLGRRVTVRDVLLVVQIAICGVLVTSSPVALRGMARSMDGHYGFEPRRAMVVNFDLSTAGYGAAGALPVQKRMIEEVKGIPGVERAGSVKGYPPLVYAAGTRSDVFRDETRDLTQANVEGSPYRYEVSPGYFGAAGTRVLAGRDFTWHDDKTAARVAVVNRVFAEKWLGTEANAVGSFFRLRDGTRVEVAGVVENGKYQNLTEDRQPAMFLPSAQWPSTQACVIVRYRAADGQTLSAAIRKKLRQIEPGLPVEVAGWSNMMEVVLFPSRVATVALSVLGAMGAVLSVSGIFGMAAFSVSKRMKELGIRVALGAGRREVLSAALGRAFRLLGVGSVAGLLLGIAASRVLSAIVYQATPRDPVVLTGVVAVMVLVGLVATWIPAQRALLLNPSRLLREE